MISTSQREHLTYTAIWQVATLLGTAIVWWLYILPGFSEIGTNIDAANTAVETYTDLKDNGIWFNTLLRKLTVNKGKEELVKIIQAAPKETESAIRKVGSGDYIVWLRGAIGNSEEDRRKLIQAKQKLNSILPTLSPIGSSIDEENITLKEYIRFIEANILKAFDISSNIPLWIQGVSYGDNSGTIPKNIGVFDLKLDFKASNSNIQKLITFVNNSGNPAILSDSWVILDETKIPRTMSNPLMTIESLSLQNLLDANNPNVRNTGRVTIRFYVRGSSKEDIIFLREAIKERENILQKRIEIAITECKKRDILCNNKSKLEAFDTKYKEFLRSVGGTQTKSETIYALANEVNSIKSLEEEFQELVPNTLTQ